MFRRELTTLVTPPEHPLGTGCTEQEFAEMQKTFGIELPPDYTALCRTYGSGEFEMPHAGLIVRNCLEPEFWANLPLELDGTRSLFEAYDVSRPTFPEPSGLFPLGSDEYINYFLFATNELSPDTWAVCIIPRDPFPADEELDGISYRDYPMCITEFLLRLAKGWNPDDLYRGAPSPTLRFVPRPYPGAP
jgi:hypothetical protein